MKLKVETRYFVTCDGCPIGPRMDFYSGTKSVPMEVLRNPFPFKAGQGNGFTDLNEAESALSQMTKHMEAVKTVPRNQRIGGSKFWDEYEIEMPAQGLSGEGQRS